MKNLTCVVSGHLETTASASGYNRLQFNVPKFYLYTSIVFVARRSNRKANLKTLSVALLCQSLKYDIKISHDTAKLQCNIRSLRTLFSIHSSLTLPTPPTNTPQNEGMDAAPSVDLDVPPGTHTIPHFCRETAV
jgi:hypothetical protein